MKSRNFNLVVLLVLLVVTAVVVSSQVQKKETTFSAETSGSKSREESARLDPADAGSSRDNSMIVSRKTLPVVAKGPIPEPDLISRGPYFHGIVDEKAGYNLTWSDFLYVENDRKTEIPLANEEAGHFSGLAYDPTSNLFILSSLAGEGYLDFFDPGKREWKKTVSLQGKDVYGITFHNDQICGVGTSHDEGTYDLLLFFDSDGNFLRSLELSFPVVVPDPRLIPWGRQLALYSGVQRELSYRIDPESGQVTGDFRQGYQGTPAALVAIYEASDDHDSIGTLEVTIDPKSPSVLVLSAYEAVHWKIWDGEHLTKVVINGYDKPEISGLPENCEVSIMSYEISGENLPFAHEIQSYEMCRLLSELEKQGIGVESIAAAYQATSASVW